MKKIGLFFVFAILIIFMTKITAGLIEVEVNEKEPVIIKELNKPAVFEFSVTNKGFGEDFELYSLVGVKMNPPGFFELERGTNVFDVEVFPSEQMRKTDGLFMFEYQIKGQESGEIYKSKLVVRVVPLKETLSLEIAPISPGDSNAIISLRNQNNVKLSDVNIELDSVFFKGEKKMSFLPFERVNFSASLDKNKMSGIVAGSYIIKAKIKMENANAEISGLASYAEKRDVVSSKDSSGLIIRKSIMKEVNVGNIPLRADIKMSKNIISRLVTTFNEEPSKVNRNGFFVDYVWDTEINPGATLEIVSTTNYTLPVLCIILIAIIVFLVRKYTATALIVNKKVSFVKTRGGEFALRVTLQLKARKRIDKVEVIENLPRIGKLYEGYGRKPDHIDEVRRKLSWNVGTMHAGEERVFSYIIYSKLNVIGRFSLPSARAAYVIDGKTEDVFSNATYFVNEVAGGD